MRLVVRCVVVLCAASGGAGCKKPLTPTDLAGTPTSAPTIRQSLTPPVAAEGLYVESVLLERPVGDALLTRDLWAATLPAGERETRTLLTENGVRVGVLGRNLPQQLQDMLDSETDTVDPRGLTFNVRKEVVLPTAGPVDPCKFSLLADLAGKSNSVELKQARCGIQVKPQAVDSGHVRVACEPQIQHGDRIERYRPTDDGTGIVKFEEVPLERFPTLAFDVTLGPEDCLVIGGAMDRPDTLGAILFGVEANGQPRQRVLVIRARQLGRSATGDLPVITTPFRRR